MSEDFSFMFGFRNRAQTVAVGSVVSRYSRSLSVNDRMFCRFGFASRGRSWSGSESAPVLQAAGVLHRGVALNARSCEAPQDTIPRRLCPQRNRERLVWSPSKLSICTLRPCMCGNDGTNQRCRREDLHAEGRHRGLVRVSRPRPRTSNHRQKPAVRVRPAPASGSLGSGLPHDTIQFRMQRTRNGV
jgi:hypothetical protein